MKRILALFTFVFLSACGTQPGTTQAQDDAKCACTPNPTIMKFKSETGYESVSWGEVLEVTVQLNETLDGDPQVIKSFRGEDIPKILSQFSLFNPKEGGLAASIQTGAILIVHRNGSDTSASIRTLHIQNERLITDPGFPNVAYDPAMLLDREWLASQ